jgi:hypothetical protein
MGGFHGQGELLAMLISQKTYHSCSTAEIQK